MTASHSDMHLHRSRQIAGTLARHGLGYLVGIVGLERLVPFQQGWFGHARRDAPYTRPEHLRLALEELGPMFIKLGQILSTRADLLPPDYQAELAKLQDNVPPVPPERILATLADEFGQPVAAHFAAFDPMPLAAASIGQAHAATLHDGTEVVVKVRRPGVVEQVEEDLVILQNLATAASRRSEFAERYDLIGLAQEFAQTLRTELDYIREGRSTERFAANFVGDAAAVHVPRVFWETSTAQVLTLERIRGMKIDDLAAMDAAGIGRTALAERATKVVLKMIFEDGFFHADPHPGNFFVEPDGRIGLIDFGMVGTVDARTQDQLTQVILAVMRADTGQLVDAMLELGFARGRVDRAALQRDLEHLLGSYTGRPLGEIAISPLLERVFAVLRSHQLKLPTNLALLLKTIIMTEGLGARLDPQFHLTTVLAPYAERLIRQQLSPTQLMHKLSQASLDMARLGGELPQQLRRILGTLERGDLTIRVQPFELLMDRLERLGNRLVLSIIAAAFIVGLAVLLAVYHPPGIEQWLGVFFATGLIVAAALGAYLAWSILRSDRGS